MPGKRPEPSFEFVQLLTSHQSRLYAYVLSLLGDRTQAEDVMQETNAVLWRKAHDFKLGTNFGAWMLKIAYFQVMAHRRRLTRDRLVFDDDFLQDIAEDAEQQCEWQGEKQRRLGDCIGKLTKRHQELIRRRYTEGATLKSIAAQGGQSENSIKQALFRARRFNRVRQTSTPGGSCMTEEEKKELESLLMELTEGELSSEQSHRLAEVIRQHPGAKQQYLEYCQVHTMLAWEHGVLGDLHLPNLSVTPEPPSDSFSFWIPMAMAASLVLAGVILWSQWGAPSEMKPGETVASLTRSVAASLELFGASSDFNNGSAVRTGSYQLDEGLVQITFESGVEVVIEAPASFEIHGPEFMILNEGRLAANVTSEGVGFTVETPDAEVVDYGTEFAIEVVGERSSEVHVFKGEVEVQPKQRDTSIDPVRLVTNQATRIDHSTLIPLGISVDHQKFLRSLDEPEPTYSGNVRELLPLAYYRMAVNDDGHTLKDAAKGHENTASVVKGDTRRQPFAPGRIGSSLRLNGPKTGGYAQISSGLELPTTEFTIMAWIRTQTLPRNAVLVSDMNLSGDETIRFGLVGDHGHLGLTLANGKRFLQIVDSSPLPLEDWTHVAVVKTTEGLRLYRNGALVSSEPLNGFQAQPHNPFSIGGIPKESGGKKRNRRSGFWHGRIDELAFFGSALTSEQIENLFQLTP